MQVGAIRMNLDVLLTSVNIQEAESVHPATPGHRPKPGNCPPLPRADPNALHFAIPGVSSGGRRTSVGCFEALSKGNC